MGVNDSLYASRVDDNKSEVLFATLQMLLATSLDMIFVKDINLNYVASTDAVADMVGKSSVADIIGHTDIEIFENKELARRYIADDHKLLDGGKNLIDYIEPITDKDGEARFNKTSKYILKNDVGDAIGLLGISRDITNEVRRKQQFQQEIEYLFILPYDVYAVVYIDVSDWRIIGQKRQPIHQYKIPLFDTLDNFLAVARTGVVNCLDDAQTFYKSFSKEALNGVYMTGKNRFSLEYIRRMSDGNSYWVRDELSLMTDPENGHLCLILTIRDVDNEHKAEESLRQSAETDELTGLLNRTGGKKKIQEFLAKEGSKEMHTAFMIDIDNFKAVNDDYGHYEGDKLLKELARGIKACFRDSDIVVRLGGDEFFILAKCMTGHEAVSERSAKLLSLSKDVFSDYKSASPSISIGVSFFRDDGDTLSDLYIKADRALYLAKNRGKGQVAFASELQQP